MFTILRNTYFSEIRKRRREIEDADGAQAGRMYDLPHQHVHMEFADFTEAFASLGSDHKEALILDGFHLSIDEQHVRDLHRLFVRSADLERQVFGSEPENNVMKQILSPPLEDKTIGIVATRLTADEVLLEHLPRSNTPNRQPIKHEEGKQPNSQQCRREDEVKSDVCARRELGDEAQDVIPPPEPRE